MIKKRLTEVIADRADATLTILRTWGYLAIVESAGRNFELSTAKSEGYVHVLVAGV
jgi:hypothetical protein